MPYGPLTLGRLVLTEDWTAADKARDDGRSVTISGQEASPPLDAPEDVRARGENLLAYAGALVPVLWTAKDDRDGFYRVEAPEVTFATYGEQVTTADWQVTLARVGSEAEAEFESRLIGGNRANVYSANVTAERWHAPPVGATAYYTGSTTPSTMTRTGRDGAMTVYRGVPSDADPRWSSTPDAYLDGAVTVTVGGVVAAGLTCANLPDDWTLDNGLTRVAPAAGTGVLDITAWDAGAEEWGTPKAFDLKAAGSSLSSFDYVTILRNDPEECVVRLVKSLAPGRVTVDLTLKRGARHVAVYAQRHAAVVWRIDTVTEETATNSTHGYMTTGANDADGNRWTFGAPITVSTGSITSSLNSGSVTGFPFYVAPVVGGASPAAGDSAATIAAQYVGTPAEETKAVRR